MVNSNLEGEFAEKDSQLPISRQTGQVPYQDFTSPVIRLTRGLESLPAQVMDGKAKSRSESPRRLALTSSQPDLADISVSRDHFRLQ